MVEEIEKRACLAASFEADGRVGIDEVGCSWRRVEEAGEIGDGQIDRGEQIAKTFFLGKAGRPLFMFADLGRVAVAGKDLDLSGDRIER